MKLMRVAMGVNNLGMSRCKHCGAEYRLFSISNRDMQGLTKAWKIRHERTCSRKTPRQRLNWARPFIGKSTLDSSITVDLTHQGFLEDKDAKD